MTQSISHSYSLGTVVGIVASIVFNLFLALDTTATFFIGFFVTWGILMLGSYASQHLFGKEN